MERKAVAYKDQVICFWYKEISTPRAFSNIFSHFLMKCCFLLDLKRILNLIMPSIITKTNVEYLVALAGGCVYRVLSALVNVFTDVM